MRMDLYRLVHKAQRYHLFLLSNQMAKTDFSDAQSAAGITIELRDMIEHLRDHANNEETYIHPLYRMLNGTADRIENEHHEQEAELQELSTIADRQRWDQLYPAFNRFLANYLAHLDREELAQDEILWPHYKDEDLLAVFNRFKAERAPELAKTDLEFMLPAFNVAELAQMFRSMKASSPAPAFLGACALAESKLGTELWQHVAAQLA